MPETFVTITCDYCGCEVQKRLALYNRAKKDGSSLYCNIKCAGYGRRNNKTIEQKKAEKATYDKEYRERNKERIKKRHAEYFQRTYDPVKAAKERKKKMHKHVEYCRRPEYKRWKKEYDKRYRAKKKFGELWESALILQDIEAEYDKREAFRENKLYNHSTCKRKRQWKNKTNN